MNVRYLGGPVHEVFVRQHGAERGRDAQELASGPGCSIGDAAAGGIDGTAHASGSRRGVPHGRAAEAVRCVGVGAASVSACGMVGRKWWVVRRHGECRTVCGVPPQLHTGAVAIMRGRCRGGCDARDAKGAGQPRGWSWGFFKEAPRAVVNGVITCSTRRDVICTRGIVMHFALFGETHHVTHEVRVECFWLESLGGLASDGVGLQLR